mmetsp:Transcript_31177/g.85445  ORF Transcript_31177/g.85445 Transcript_31177/m.85445 type:complete len:514 (-) Transcript_31177:93-1634(-)
MAINVEMPFHKAKQQMAQWKHYAEANLKPPEIDQGTPDPPNILVDAVSVGGSLDGKQKPLVRHVIVKDLNKIGTRLKLEHPKTGIFSNRAPMGLYALFDGQSCAGDPGPMAAEFCARNFHTMLLERLANMPAVPADRAAVETAIQGTFEDLDRELLTNQPDVKDGCGAAVALLIGDFIFTALLGQCSAVLCQAQEGGRCSPMILGRGRTSADFHRLMQAGGFVVGDGNNPRIRHPSGALSSVTRSLGDRWWKGPHCGTGFPLIQNTPVVHCVPLKGPEDHPFLLLAASSVATALSPQELVDVANEFPLQPRVACGEIAARASENRAGTAALAQCTAVEVCFLPARPGAGEDRKRAPGAAGPEPQPLAKKTKVTVAPGGGTQSVRLRHILLRYSDAAQPAGKKALRTRQEAEAVLRKSIKELRKDLRACKKPPKDATELVNVTTKKFVELCKEYSECETARKGGSMCGDLGWLTPDDLVRMGAGFKEVVDVLSPGQFSDIAVSESGLHLVQRVA